MQPKYQSVAQAFDVVAPGYDAVYGAAGNAVMTWLRHESLALLRQTFPSGSRLLEIGCGTGDEALHLAAAGCHVLATDISPKMAQQTGSKARAAGLAGRVVAVALPAGLLSALRPAQPFDGAYASFGGLNCEPQLTRVGASLSSLLRPGAAFVCSVMNRWCLSEMAWFLLHGRPRTAVRRLRSGWRSAPVSAGAGSQAPVPVRYLTYGDIVRALGSAFAAERAFALPLLLPPPYLDDLYQRRRAFFERLTPLERRLRERWPWRYLGDHIAMVLRKR